MLPVFTGQFGDSELYYAFKKFDKSGNGYLSVSELRQILAKIGQNFTEAEVVEMMLSVGTDISKGLDFQGFYSLILINFQLVKILLMIRQIFKGFSKLMKGNK